MNPFSHLGWMGVELIFLRLHFLALKKRVFLRTVVFDTEKDEVTFKSAMHWLEHTLESVAGIEACQGGLKASSFTHTQPWQNRCATVNEIQKKEQLLETIDLNVWLLLFHPLSATEYRISIYNMFNCCVIPKAQRWENEGQAEWDRTKITSNN